MPHPMAKRLWLDRVLCNHKLCIHRLESAIPLLLREINRVGDSNVSIAFPDDGAFKRFHPMFKKFPTIICSKKRLDDKRIVRVKDGR